MQPGGRHHHQSSRSAGTHGATTSGLRLTVVEDGVPRTYETIAYGVLFHILTHIQQLLDEGREAELDQKPAPDRLHRLHWYRLPTRQKKRKLNGLAVTKQIIAYMESKNVHLAEACAR